jgi:peptidyl-prolyl cis-trans isomerase C
MKEISMKKNIKYLSLTALLLAAQWTAVQAQEKVPAGNFAIVNNTPLPNYLFDQVIKNNIAQGAKETPEMRSLVKSELVGRAVLSQEAVKQGLDKLDTTLAQLELLRQNYLTEVLVATFAAKNPIEDAVVRLEYDRQVAALKDSKEYRIKDIVLADEARAKVVMASLRQGASFEKLAQENSIDASKSASGDLGWLLAEQINPLISNVIVNLSKGALAAAPIQAQNGWHIIKLEDIRNFSPPKFEESKAQIRQGLMLKQRNEFINKLMSEARIQVRE